MVMTRGSKRKQEASNVKQEQERQEEGSFSAPPHQLIRSRRPWLYISNSPESDAQNMLSFPEHDVRKRMSRMKATHVTENFDVSEAVTQKDGTTLAEKHSEGSVDIQQSKQSESAHLSGTSVQATVMNSTIQPIQLSEGNINAIKNQYEQEASVRTANVVAAEENVLVTEGEGTVRPSSSIQKQEKVIQGPKSSGELHVSEKSGPPAETLKCNLKAVTNSFARSSQHTTSADETTSREGDDVASNNFRDGAGGSSSNWFRESSLMQQAASLNLTEIAEQMVNGELCEVDSLASDTNSVSVKGYKVKPKYAALLDSVLSKYGDIAANCYLGSVASRSFFLELLCEDIQKLMDTKFIDITEVALEEMLAHVGDFEKASIEIRWFRMRLFEILEAKQAIQLLRLSSNVKQHKAERKSKIEKMNSQLEIYKSELAIKRAELEDLEQKIHFVKLDISGMENEVNEVEKVIAENRFKLRRVYELKSLAHGLIET